jgi:hypothetical protein
VDGGGGTGWCSFFSPFLNRSNSFLAKKRKSDLQFWRHDGLCGFD